MLLCVSAAALLLTPFPSLPPFPSPPPHPTPCSNAMNALSEDNSLVQMPPWRNPWLLVAMVVSLGLHAVILYVPLLADIFSIVPLSLNECLLVLAYSLPVILLDEVCVCVWMCGCVGVGGVVVDWVGCAGGITDVFFACAQPALLTLPPSCLPACLPACLEQVLKFIGRNFVNKPAALPAKAKED